MAKKILLFGGSGLLGIALQKACVRTGAHVVAPSHEEANITDYASIEKIILREAPDMIINAAALIDVNELEKDPLPGWKVNTFAAAAIARILAKHSLDTTYLFISTSYVFGNENKLYIEDDKPSPINAYGRTKALAEHLVTHYFRGRSAHFYIIRTCWIYSGTRPTFVDQVAKTLLTGGDFDASTDQYGNLTSASDLADTVVSTFAGESQKSGIYHCFNASQSEQGISRFDIATEVSTILKVSTSHIKKTSSDAIFAAKRPSAVLCNTKLAPMRDWREALREYLLEHYVH